MYLKSVWTFAAETCLSTSHFFFFFVSSKSKKEKKKQFRLSDL